MTVEHGDADKAANSGRGIHPIYGRPDVANEAARIALSQNASDIGRVVRQTGGDRPGSYVLLGTTGQTVFVGEGKLWENLTTHTVSGALKQGHLNRVQVTTTDLTMDLPALSTMREGDAIVVSVITTGATAGQRAIIDAAGADTIISGLGVSTAVGVLHLQGNFETFLFIASTALSGWFVVPISGDSREGVNDRYAVTYAKTEPLDTFTPSGSGQDQRLTASANGAFQVDGVSVSFNNTFRTGILVAGESGANRQYHGVWQLEQEGDGANPWILRRRPDMGLEANYLAGPAFVVNNGVHQGNVFQVPGETSFATAFDWIISKGGSEKTYTPSALSADADDYQPGSYDKWRFGDVHRLSASTPVTISGFVPTPWKRRIANVGNNAITLAHEDTGSTAANRFQFPNGNNITLLKDEYADIIYDETDSRWKILASASLSTLFPDQTFFDATVQTTDATVTTIATYATLANERVIKLKFDVIGRQPTTDDSISFSVEATFNRDGSAVVTSLDETNVVSYKAAGASAWDVTLSVSSQSILIRVTGEASKTIEWRIVGKAFEHGA